MRRLLVRIDQFRRKYMISVNLVPKAGNVFIPEFVPFLF